MTIPESRPTVSIPENTCQSSKAELEADLRVKATFDDAMDAVLRPVKMERIKKPKRWGFCSGTLLHNPLSMNHRSMVNLNGNRPNRELTV